jgi:hypothetical protein
LFVWFVRFLVGGVMVFENMARLLCACVERGSNRTNTRAHARHGGPTTILIAQSTPY